MSLSELIPGEEDRIDRAKTTTLFWLACLVFSIVVAGFLLLQRLGLPVGVMVGLIATMSVVLLAGLTWISRTMTNAMYFFAGRTLGPFVSGLGGATDVMSGAYLALLLSAPLSGKMALALAIGLAIVIQATLFSVGFQRSGASSLAGFFVWRLQSKWTGMVVRLCVTLILALIALAELQIAGTIVASLTELNPRHAIWVILALAVLPGVFGGWLGLLLINAVLVIWMLICTLTPAVAVGFFTPFLQQAVELDIVSKPLEALELIINPFWSRDSNEQSVYWLLLTVTVISAGISVLPHSLSRLSTTGRPLEAIESVGWVALLVFLLLSAIPLSVGLVVSTPTSAKLTILLQAQPALQMLPYFALLFAAFNCLSVTLFALSGSITRAINRFQTAEQSERSLFPTRVVIILLAIGLAASAQIFILPVDRLLLSALMIGAGGLFVPLVASIWAVEFSPRAYNLAISLGTIVTSLLLYLNWIGQIQSPITAGSLGLLTCLVVLAGSWLRSRHLDQPLSPNDIALYLRRQ